MGIASAASRLLASVLSYSIFTVVLCAFVVLRLSWGYRRWRSGESYSLRETASIMFPILVSIVAVAIGIFAAQEAHDILAVARTNPGWALYGAAVSVLGLAGLAFAVVSHVRESQRPYNILDTTVNTLNASQNYSRLLLLQAKAAAVWLCAFGIGIWWLRDIANGR
jgi:hypothetical protein